MRAQSMLLLIAVIAMAALAGCGGGDDDGGSEAVALSGPPLETSSLSKEEFIKEASKACERERAGLIGQVEVYLKNHEKGSEAVTIAGLAKTVMAPVIESEIEAVREIGAPEGEEDTVEAMLAANQESVEEVKKLKRAKTLEDVEDHFMKASKLYQEYGFESCVNSP